MKEKAEEKPRKKVVVEEVGTTSPETPPVPETPKEEKVSPMEPAPQASERIPEKYTKVPSSSSPSKLRYLLFIIPGLLLIALLIGGIYVYIKGVSQNNETAIPEATFETLPSPTPTATPASIDLSKYTIALQNGSGIPGEATKVQGILSGGGFKIVSIGNAKTYDYQKTIIQAKASVPDTYMTQLSNLLGKTYVLGDNEKLPDTSKIDVVIIIGKTKS